MGRSSGGSKAGAVRVVLCAPLDPIWLVITLLWRSIVEGAPTGEVGGEVPGVSGGLICRDIAPVPTP